MLSEARQERSALRWVRSDLESVLQEARHGLEDYVNGQPERLQVCIERLHQVHRSLDLMQVCEEPEEIVNAIFSHYEKRSLEPSEAEQEIMLEL